MTENEALYHLPETDEVRVLITGSRDWDDYDTMYAALSRVYDSLKPRDPILVHGAAKGADISAETIWKRLGGRTEAHPAQWTKHQDNCSRQCIEHGTCRRAGFVRNAEMVDKGATLCVAFIKNNSKGASMCAKLAEKAKIPTVRYLA